MSRIYEALRKAQDGQVQQAAQSPAEPRSVETIPPILPPPIAVFEAPSSGIPAPEYVGSLTVDMLLARCPQAQWHPDRSLLLFQNGNDYSAGKEVFRTLRARLYQIRVAQPLRTVLITSALPSEGKTFLISNLAHSIVRQPERRVLLIDGDLRQSRLHQVLGAPSSPGLTDYLLGEADEFAILHRGEEPNLFLIPGGKPVSNPTELLSNGRLEHLLTRLGAAFDWVLIDSAPTIPVSDASMLSKHCDGVLIVVRAGATPYDLAQKTRQEFQGKNLVGVVLNRADSGRDSSYERYYSGHYNAQNIEKN